VISENKKKPKPAPTSYIIKSEMDTKSSTNKKTMRTEEKYCSFIEEARITGL